MSLSLRGQDESEPGGGRLIWEILKDLWDPQSNPNGYVSLGVAENYLLHDRLLKHIHDNLALTEDALTYGTGTTGSIRLKKAVARFLTRQLKPARDIDESHVTITNGCSAAVENTVWAIANPGDGILLGQPYYGTFPVDITLRTGAELVRVAFDGVDPISTEAVAKYEEALLAAQKTGQKIAGIVLCNPHNPLGRCYPRDVIVGLMRLCQKYDLHLISDEIYALSVWSETGDGYSSPTPFVSCLSINTEGIIDASRVHVIWGMSKDFGANGIRVGAVISQNNPSFHKVFVPLCLYSYVSSIADHAAANILEDDKWVDEYVATNRKLLADNYRTVTKWARDHGIEYMPGVQAAFFLWVDLGRAYRARHADVAEQDLDEGLRKALLANRVFIASGVDFGSEKPGWFRIVFSNKVDLLTEGLRRIIATIEG